MSTSACPTNVPAAFAKLSLEQKRVAIAKDVIEQLRAKQLIATTGVFVYLNSDKLCRGSELAIIVKEKPDLTVKQLLAEQEVKTCEVCALGGIMMAQFRVNGDCKASAFGVYSVSGPPKLTPYTRESWDSGRVSEFAPFVLAYFTKTQLELIEIAFELGAGALCCADYVDEFAGIGSFDEWAEREKTAVTLEEATRAVDFGREYEDDDEKRLIAIMANIVANNGTFVP